MNFHIEQRYMYRCPYLLHNIGDMLHDSHLNFQWYRFVRKSRNRNGEIKFRQEYPHVKQEAVRKNQTASCKRSQ